MYFGELLLIVYFITGFVPTVAVKLVRSEGDSIGGAGVVLTPSDGQYSNVLIFMHGLGDTATGWEGMFQMLNLGSTKYIIPTAQERSISLNSGMQMTGWFDVTSLDGSTPEDALGLEESALRIRRILELEMEYSGLPSTKISVGGFSQGGALALHFGLRSVYELAGVIALSTWLPFSNEYPEALSVAGTKLKLWMAHGTADKIVSVDRAKAAYAILDNMVDAEGACYDTESGGANSRQRLQLYEGQAHSSSAQEMSDMRNILIQWFQG